MWLQIFEDFAFPFILAIFGIGAGVWIERFNSRRRRQSDTVDFALKVIGETIAQIRSELSAKRGDDFESGENVFQHLETLPRLRALADLERPFLPTAALEIIDGLCESLRIYARARLIIAMGQLEKGEDYPLENIHDKFLEAQTKLSKMR